MIKSLTRSQLLDMMMTATSHFITSYKKIELDF